MLQILHFVPPIAASQRAVLPYQHTFTNPNIVCPAYLLPCPHPHSTPLPNAPAPSPLAGKKEAASIISGSSVCTTRCGSLLLHDEELADQEED